MFFVTALTNDKSELIISETKTTDEKIAYMVMGYLREQGHKVLFRKED